MPNLRQIQVAAQAIHAYELAHGYITREWNGAHAEPVYMEIAKAALEAAEQFSQAHKTHSMA